LDVSPLPAPIGMPNTMPRSSKSSSLDFSETLRKGFLGFRSTDTSPPMSLSPIVPVILLTAQTRSFIWSWPLTS
jgi:hypothetical protein